MAEFRFNPRGDQRGFTLIEMLLALGVLVFGISSLIGVLSVGVGTRRAAEMRGRAVLLAEHVLHDLKEGLMAGKAMSTAVARSDEEVEMTLDPEMVEGVDGYPGMKYRVTFAVDPEDPKLVLATVEITWREQGAQVGQKFRRILVRERPFSQRVANKRSSR